MRLPVINLNRREKMAVAAAAAGLVIFCGLQWGILPLLDQSERLSRAIAAKTLVLDELVQLRAQAQALDHQVEASKGQLAQRNPQFSLFSFLDQLTGQIGIKDKIVYMKPSTSPGKDGGPKIALVEMKLQGLTLAQLVDYLHQIETSTNMIRVQWLAITKGDKSEGFIDAVLQAETIEQE
jgi:hypothetical protein